MKSIFYIFSLATDRCLAGFVKEKWRPLRKEKCVYFINILFRFRPNYCDIMRSNSHARLPPSSFKFKGDARIVLLFGYPNYGYIRWAECNVPL